MERAKKTWLLEIVVAAILAALAGLWGWTALRVVENGERIIEVKAELQTEIAEVRVELQKEIAEVRVDLQRDLGREIAKNREQIAEVKTELGRDIAEVNAKLDLLIGGLDISVVPEESADAGSSGAERGGFQAGAGETATG